MISKAEKFYKKDKFKQAEELCLQVLESDQGNVDALRLQSLIMLKTGRVQQGLEFLKLALGQSPENTQNNLAMGLYCIALKKIPEAMNAFLRAYQADPTNTETLLYLGDLHSAQQEWNKALVFYGLYINIDPTNAFVNQTYASHLANCHFKEYSEVQKTAMEHVLKDDRINVRRMLRHWLNMLFNLPSSQKLAKAIAEKKYDLKILEPLLDSAFFIKGIEKLRLNSPIIELFLIGIRRELLSSIIKNPHFDLAPYSHFLYALSMQSWMNEYSFFIDETEKNLIEKLRNITSEKVNNLDSDHTTIPLIYLYSCYDSPLNITNISQRTKKIKKT